MFTWMEAPVIEVKQNEEHIEKVQSHNSAPGYLAVSMKIRTKPKELAEDEAAVWCLIQNLRILAKEQGIGLHIQQPETAHEVGWRNCGKLILVNKL
ncbi:hypothetical protein ACFVQB_15315 [Paenibacillus sp. NPDC057886]|uniref:hypothetical protein n=1 Tax=Paenibacillus sp. NPDC057886 TaxID=3346270 RepID=UPI0036CF52F8